MAQVLPQGTFPLALSSSLLDLAASAKKRKRDAPPDELVALKYAFKPASINDAASAQLEAGPSGRALRFDAATGHQVFDAREEPAKTRECVLVWLEDEQIFKLYPLSSTLHLTPNRSLSGRPAPVEEPELPPPAPDSDGEEDVPVAVTRKRSRPSEVAPPPPPARPRQSTGGKSLPRKAPPKPAPPVASTRKSAAPARRAAAKPLPTGKFKSAEIIEDSDEEEAPVEDDEDDEFAKMMGETLGNVVVDEDDEEEEEEEDDENDELGGARLVGGYSANDGDVEWI